MEAFYIKQQVSYMNGGKTPKFFIRIKSDGVITVISTARKTISQPKTISLHKGFSVITKEEFEKELHIVYNGLPEEDEHAEAKAREEPHQPFMNFIK